MIDGIRQRYTRIDSTNRQRPDESRDDFYRRLLQAAEERRETADRTAVLAARYGGNKVDLTDAQKEMLSETYDLQDMSREDLEALLQDLEAIGCFSGEEAWILGYSVPSRLNGIWAAPGPDVPEVSLRFQHPGGDLLEWARFRASYQTIGPDGVLCYDRTALLFGKLYDILTQI